MRTSLEQSGTIKPINSYNKPLKTTLETPQTPITHLEDPLPNQLKTP